jgi:hypothetical protein
MSKPESTDDVAGAILSDGRVDIDFPQREIASDLSNDARYSVHGNNLLVAGYSIH